MQNYFEMSGAEGSTLANRPSTERARLRRMWVAEYALDDEGQLRLKMPEVQAGVARDLKDKVSMQQLGFDVALQRLGRRAVLGLGLPDARPSVVSPGQWRVLLAKHAEVTGQPTPPQSLTAKGNGKTKKPTAPPTPPPAPLPAAAAAPTPPTDRSVDPRHVLGGLATAFRDFAMLLEDVARDFPVGYKNGNGNGGGHAHVETAPPAAPLHVDRAPAQSSKKDDLEALWPHTTKAGWRIIYESHFLRAAERLDATTRSLLTRALARFADNPSDPQFHRKRMAMPAIEKRYPRGPELKLHYLRVTVTYRLFVNVNESRRVYLFEDFVRRGAIPEMDER